MAEIRVIEKKSHWWIWLIGLLILAEVIWFLVDAFSDDPVPTAAGPTTTTPATVPVATTAAAPAAIATPPVTSPAGDVPASAGAPSTAAGGPITDTGAYAAVGDKLSLVGRDAEFTNARVTAVVGPNTFRIATGGEDLFVMLGEDLAGRGVGTQGNIDVGDVLKVTGSFRRLSPEEISDIANSRFSAT